MRVLALDTTTAAGSIALVEDDRVVDERCGDASRPHAERLPGDVIELLRAYGAALSDVDVFAVASGPGSFTGLRIGIATVQGLALVHRRRVVGVSALEALAQAGGADAAPGTNVAAWMDGRRREVFSALYQVRSGRAYTPARLEELEAAAVGGPEATLARWNNLRLTSAVYVGDGAMCYREVLQQSGVPHASIIAPPPLAGVVGRLAVALARQGDATNPAAVRPLYVRRPDVEVARDRVRSG